jgi:hypothetical protein
MRLAKHICLSLLFGLLWFVPWAQADVTVLLEEPYSYDGALAGTGHTAVYFSRICAESPTVLRRCHPGEAGAVISRYHSVGGYDWIAIPLIPYLYAVEKPDDIPLIANAKLEASLRDRYRRKHLENVAPDLPSGETPGGNWYELVGSAYDRTLYGFQIETSVAKDDEFITAYNTAPNRMSYKVVTRNCADFVREAVNFYYPKAVGRSFLADLEVSTPKHAAKSLVKYAHKHPELEFTSFIIPQVPGTIKRSTPIHGLVDSVFKAKKYEVPLMVFHPFIAGGVAVAYVTSGRFDPEKKAMVLDTKEGTFERPLTADERRAYEKGLQEILQAEPEPESTPDNPSWKQFQAKAELHTDSAGHPVLQASFGDNFYQVGISRENILTASAPSELTRQLLVTRLRDELKSNTTARKVSDANIREDWNLLQEVISASRAPTVSRTVVLSSASRGATD